MTTQTTTDDDGKHSIPVTQNDFPVRINGTGVDVDGEVPDIDTSPGTGGYDSETISDIADAFYGCYSIYAPTEVNPVVDAEGYSAILSLDGYIGWRDVDTVMDNIDSLVARLDDLEEEHQTVSVQQVTVSPSASSIVDDWMDNYDGPSEDVEDAIGLLKSIDEVPAYIESTIRSVLDDDLVEAYQTIGDGSQLPFADINLDFGPLINTPSQAWHLPSVSVRVMVEAENPDWT